MEEPPAGFLCPITMLPMLEPVVTADGQTYERDAIQGWLLTHNTSPATGAVLPHKELAPNFALRKAIETWEETTQMKVPRANIEFPERPIGAGAFKTVYQGSVLIAGQRVPAAVLRIREESIETEVQTFLKLGRHPRLVRFLGQCTEGGDLLLLTEFAEMGSLSDAFEQLEGKLSPAHKRVMTLQICQGMEHLAEMKFIHRDLAARNCLLFAFSEEDVRVTSVKVSDFGLTVRKNYNQTYAVGVEGEARPLRWLAPEALRFNRFSEKTDVFSLGITIYEIYSEGQIPYFDILEKDLVAHVLGGGRPSRAHIGGGCPDDVWQIIEVCVDKDPKRRPRFSELLPMLMLSVNGDSTEKVVDDIVAVPRLETGGQSANTLGDLVFPADPERPRQAAATVNSVRSSATGELGVVTGVVVDFDFESRGQRPSVFTDGLGGEPQPVPLQPVRGSRKTIVAGLACMLLIGLAIGIPLAISGSGSGSTAAPSPTGPTSTPAPSQTLYAVKMVFELVMALASFSSDKQVKFREAVAAAADVQTSDVTIDKISKIAGSRRAGESIRVETSINVADANAADTLQATLTPDKINAELQNVGLPSATILTEGQSEEKEPCSRGFTGPDGQCVKCVAGKYKESAGSADCTLCAESTYSSVAGATSMSTCVACPANSNSVAGSAATQDCACAPGFAGACIRPTSGSECVADCGDSNGCCDTNKPDTCDFYRYNDCCGLSGGPNGGTCTICPAGKFKAASGPAACSDCPSGTYSSSSGAVSAGTCVACPTHSASPPASDASGDCACNAGYTGPNGGPCTACEEGKYKDSPGTGACTVCPANSVSPAGSTEAVACGCDLTDDQMTLAAIFNIAACQLPPVLAKSSFNQDCNEACALVGENYSCDRDATSSINSEDIFNQISPLVYGWTCESFSSRCVWSGSAPFNDPYYGNRCFYCPDTSTTRCDAKHQGRNRVCACKEDSPAACPANSVSPAGSDASGDCACNAGYTGPNGGTCTACETGKYKDSPGAGACTACPANSASPAGADFLLSVTAASGRTIEAIPYSQISVGSRVFTDRDYSFNSIGDYSARTFYIRGPNDDKRTPAASLQWTITVDVPVIVYLDFYNGQETMGFAQWNHGWKVSSMSSISLWLNSNHQEGPGVVYEKYFAAGEISLYGNDGAHQGTYLAFVARAHGGSTQASDCIRQGVYLKWRITNAASLEWRPGVETMTLYSDAQCSQTIDLSAATMSCSGHSPNGPASMYGCQLALDDDEGTSWRPQTGYSGNLFHPHEVWMDFEFQTPVAVKCAYANGNLCCLQNCVLGGTDCVPTSSAGIMLQAWDGTVWKTVGNSQGTDDPQRAKVSDGSDASGCNAGYTGPNGGPCTACEAGKYKDSPGPAACTACPADSTSPAGSIQATSCSTAGFFHGFPCTMNGHINTGTGSGNSPDCDYAGCNNVVCSSTSIHCQNGFWNHICNRDNREPKLKCRFGHGHGGTREEGNQVFPGEYWRNVCPDAP